MLSAGQSILWRNVLDVAGMSEQEMNGACITGHRRRLRPGRLLGRTLDWAIDSRLDAVGVPGVLNAAAEIQAKG